MAQDMQIKSVEMVEVQAVEVREQIQQQTLEQEQPHPFKDLMVVLEVVHHNHLHQAVAVDQEQLVQTPFFLQVLEMVEQELF
jgi:hypothetical protein